MVCGLGLKVQAWLNGPEVITGSLGCRVFKSWFHCHSGVRDFMGLCRVQDRASRLAERVSGCTFADFH